MRHLLHLGYCHLSRGCHWLHHARLHHSRELLYCWLLDHSHCRQLSHSRWSSKGRHAHWLHPHAHLRHAKAGNRLRHWRRHVWGDLLGDARSSCKCWNLRNFLLSLIMTESLFNIFHSDKVTHSPIIFGARLGKFKDLLIPVR